MTKPKTKIKLKLTGAETRIYGFLLENFSEDTIVKEPKFYAKAYNLHHASGIGIKNIVRLMKKQWAYRHGSLNYKRLTAGFCLRCKKPVN